MRAYRCQSKVPTVCSQCVWNGQAVILPWAQHLQTSCFPDKAILSSDEVLDGQLTKPSHPKYVGEREGGRVFGLQISMRQACVEAAVQCVHICGLSLQQHKMWKTLQQDRPHLQLFLHMLTAIAACRTLAKTVYSKKSATCPHHRKGSPHQHVQIDSVKNTPIYAIFVKDEGLLS